MLELIILCLQQMEFHNTVNDSSCLCDFALRKKTTLTETVSRSIGLISMTSALQSSAG